MILKKSIGKIFAAFVLLFFSVTAVTAQCTILGMDYGCTNQSMGFSKSCQNTGSYHWYIGYVGGEDKGTGTSMTHTFTAPGTYTIVMTQSNGGGTTAYYKTVEVANVPTTPQISPSKAEFCSTPATQTFTISNPQSGVTYYWTLTPGGYVGSGTSYTVTNATVNTSIGVWAQLDGTEECGSSGYANLYIRTTDMTPAVDVATPYHKRLIRGSGGIGTEAQHYWQTSASGTEVVANLAQDYAVTQPGNYYIRRQADNGSCWGVASSPVVVTINYTPPQAYIVQVQKRGYNEINLAIADQQHVLTFADYYWVNGSSSTEILGEFYAEGEKREWKKYANGTYYLRGRDRATNTWGPSYPITVSLLGEASMNWIHTKTFDGYSNTITVEESKGYFDYSGKSLQSQTRNISADYIFATQSLRDKRGRVVGSTLPAPIVPKTFTYNSGFVQDGLQNEYEFNDFDTPETIYNPNPVGDFNQGTVGWYYSDNNNIEPLVGKTNFPYSRQEFYEDGTGEVKRSASPGDYHRLGMGHEVRSRSFPVFGELNDYLSKRTVAIPGITQDGSLVNEAMQGVTRDENGQYAVAVSDREGRTVFTARSGTLADHVFPVTNVITASADPEAENFKKEIYFYLLNDQPVTIENEDYGTNVRYGSTIEENAYDPAKNRFIASESVRLLPGFEVTGGQTFEASLGGSTLPWTIENLVTGETSNIQFFEDSLGNWPAGFYKITLHTGELTLTYTNYYKDVSYQFYNDAGALVSSVSPNGYKAWKTGTPYASIDKTTFAYNFRGWLLSTTEPDAGTSTFKYRKDGKIRFSQNAKQSGASVFSYTHYDELGRPIESGEYTGTAYTYSNLASQLEYATQVMYTSNTKDWIKTRYDTPDPKFNDSTQLQSIYPQHFLDGAVSRTENENITTWYSYDELGRVVWMAQKPKALNKVFVSTYEYDFLGNVLKSGSLTYQSAALIESFYHHYQYDADKRLVKAFTSTDGSTLKVRATYTYYLHGPLKRVELGDGIQGIDFVYNIHGWLTQINHPSLQTANDPGGDGTNGVRKDAFGMILDYYESEMEDLFATAAVAPHQNPEQFHKLPGAAPLQDESRWAFKPQLVMPQTQDQWAPPLNEKETKLPVALVSKDDPELNRIREESNKAYLKRLYTSVETYTAPSADLSLNEETLVASATSYTAVMPVGVVDDAIELAALKQVYDSLGGSGWTIKTNWPTPGNWPASATAAQMDAWYGITVTNGDITGIYLVSNNCTGKIPAAISQLSELTALQLNNNSIGAKIPASLGSLTKLASLYLNNNGFTGSIPSQLGNMTAIMDLQLNANPSLTGSIPGSLKKLSNLITLNLSSNTGLTGTLPPLGKLGNLQTLNLSGLTGLTTAAIPAWLDSLRNLVTLNLDNSKRNGSIPSFIGNLTDLQTLSLRSNQLTGSIPTGINLLTDLRSLLLDNNQLSGAIPEIGGLSLLTTLWLYNNQLSGNLPPSLYSLTALTSLQLFNNYLTGTLSEEIENLTALVTLDLHSNDLFDRIPSNIGNLTNLTTLSLDDNQFSGSLPAAIQNLNKLVTFSVHTNKLSGEVPPLGTLTMVEYFYLYNNSFTGSIGSWVGTLTKLRYFRIDGNRFTTLDAGLLNSTQLTHVYLTDNELISVPNFFTYSGKANLRLYINNNYLDFSDLEPLFGSGTPGYNTFVFANQKRFNPGTRVHAPTGSALQIPAQPKGSFSTVTWEKQSGSSWVNVNSSNGDATHQTFSISNATTAVNGYYRWKMTNTRATGFTLQSAPIEVQAVDPAPAQPNNAALFNGIIASARWQTESPVLDEPTDNLTGMYVYDYDDKYQIEEANFAQPNYLTPGTFAMQGNQYRVNNLAYDPNGNIQTLSRYDKDGIRTNNFSYAYEANKNKLTSVTGYVGNYTYNAIGQMTDEEKVDGDDQHVEYDVSGKVVSVSRPGVSTAGLTGNYLFSGNMQNSASGMGEITPYNGAILGTDRNSQVNAAAYTDGTDDYMLIDDPSGATNFRDTDFTISYWVKRQTSVASRIAGVNKWNTTASPGTSEWALNTGNGSTFYPSFAIEIGSTSYTAVGTTSLTTGQWYHLTGVRKDGYIKIYVNGVLQASTYVGTGAINSNTALPVYVGKFHPGSTYTNSVFDEIKIFNRGLNDGEVQQVMNNSTVQVVKARYKYDDRGFRLTKTVYPNATPGNIGTDVLTTWYIRDASGNVISIYEQDGEPKKNNVNAFTQTEKPIYGSGKLGTYYPAQDGSMNYEITDHLGNVRALVRENVNIYTATMEDDGTVSITNPRVQELEYFKNIDETEMEDARFNHTPGVSSEYSAYLYWIAGATSAHKKIGPAITLKVNTGDTVNAETWVRYENKLSYSRNTSITALAGLLAGNFSFTQAFETYTLSQTTTTFSNALTTAGFMGDGADTETPFAYINYILFDESMTMVDAGWRRVNESMGFDPGQEALTFHQHKRLSLAEPVYVPENGYIYIWVSNESEGTKIWFDDLKIAHTQVVVTQATDYGVWGDVLSEQKSPYENKYRFGYQGQFAERDEETGWNHFELREYDPVIGRWTTKDPYGQYYSPYVGMGNDPVNGTDLDGGEVFNQGVNSRGEIVFDDGAQDGNIFLINQGYSEKITDLATLVANSCQIVKENIWIGTDSQLSWFVSSQYKFVGFDFGSPVLNKNSFKTGFTSDAFNTTFEGGKTSFRVTPKNQEDRRLIVNYIRDSENIFLGDVYNLRNSLEHEKKHFFDADAMQKGKLANPMIFKSRDERFNFFEQRGVEYQKTRPSWYNTTPAYKNWTNNYVK